MAIHFPPIVPKMKTDADGLAPDHALVRIASGSAQFFIGTFLGLGLNYLYAIVLARLLGPEQFGLYALGLGYFNLVSVIALGGLDTAVLRFIPALRMQNDATGIGRIVRTVLVLSAGLGLAFAAALLLTADTVASRFFHNDEASAVLKWFSISIPLLVISTIGLAALQAFREVRWRTAAKYLVEPVLKFGITFAFIWAGWGLMSALIALPVALGLTALLTLFPLRQFWLERSEPVVSKIDLGEVVKYSLPLLGGLILNGIASRSDVLFLGYWATVDEVGVYSAAFQTAAILAVVLGTLESIATPFLSESISRNDLKQVHALAGTLLRWTVIVTLPLCIILAVFADNILSLFGKQFETGSVCLIILVIGQFANCMTGCSNGMLLWAGRSRLIMWNNLVISILQIGLYLLLIPAYGIIGAALGVSACLVVGTVLRIVQAHHVFDIWPYDVTVAKPLASGFLSLGLILTIQAVFPTYESGVLVGFFAMAYAALLLIFGLQDGDRTMLLHLRQRFSQTLYPT